MPRKKGKQPAPETPSRLALSVSLERLFTYNKERNLQPRNAQEIEDLSSGEVAKRTVRNMITLANDTGLSNIDKVASTIGVPAWTLLFNDSDAELLRIIRVYVRSSPSGRRLIGAAADTAERMDDESKRRDPDRP